MKKIQTAPLREIYKMPQARSSRHKLFKEAVGLITPEQIARERLVIQEAGAQYRRKQEQKAAEE